MRKGSKKYAQHTISWPNTFNICIMIVHEHVYFILQIGTDAADIVAEYMLEEAAGKDEYATADIEDNEATFQV